ncbi:hypothetical protein HZC07_02110 [Candidatus Micrarchaeota archaeon]|nr:hypothetical protein [Candidatus Micrarchaeota archaeon]
MTIMDLKKFPFDLKLLFRIFILLLLPFIVGTYLLPHTEIVSGNQLPSPSNKSDVVNGNYAFSPDGLHFPSRVNTIFPLANYLNFEPFVTHPGVRLCFQDQGSSLNYSNGTVYDPTINWLILLNNRSLVVNSNGANCTSFDSIQQINYTWQAKLSLKSTNLSDLNSRLLFFSLKTTTYPEWEVDYGVLQGLSLISATYLFVYYPLFGIWKKIEKGLKEQ